MHSNTLGTKFLPRTQELRIQGIIDSTPRFAPWGAKAWRAPKGFTWNVFENNPVPEAVLARDTDHNTVMIAQRYSYPVFVDDETIVLARSNDSVPAIYVAKVNELNTTLEPPLQVTKHNGHCFFPSLNRAEINEMVPNLPALMVGHYFLEGAQYVWSWRPKTGEFHHLPLDWYNNSNPAIGRESIEMLRTDPSTGLVIGSGANIPSFVMTPDFKRMIGFIRTYKDGKLDESSVGLINRWNDRIAKQFGPSYAYIG
jgi:hypothetical protein